jgi:uncharacterized protein YodC (DUF2158 family)
MADNLKPGDVVQLKSGGPMMTVKDFGYGGKGDEIMCVWFEKNEQRNGTFVPAMLDKTSG